MTHIALLWATNVQMLAITGGTVSPLDALQAIEVNVFRCGVCFCFYSCLRYIPLACSLIYASIFHAAGL
jgi:hypothetical protein